MPNASSLFPIISLEGDVLIVAIEKWPCEEHRRAWLSSLLSTWQLNIHEYEINADYHQASFYFDHRLYLITINDITQQIWINATHQEPNQLKRLFAHIS